MRDIFVTLVVFGSLPLILWRPFYGIIMWTWLGYMNPHRMAWGFVAKRRRQVDLLLAHDERRRSEARSLVADASRYMYSRYRSRRAAPRISRRSTIQN